LPSALRAAYSPNCILAILGCFRQALWLATMGSPNDGSTWHHRCRKCCSCLVDLLSSIPFMGIVWTVASLLGLSVTSNSKSKVMEVFEQAGGLESIVSKASLFDSVISILMVLDIIALFSAFLASGKCRDLVFRSKSERCPCLCGCLQCLAGPCALQLLEVIMALCFIVILVLSYIVCVITLFCEGIGAICDSSSEAISSMQQVIEELNKFGVIDMQFDLTEYCGFAEDLGADSVFLFVGLVIMVISQAGLLACLASYKSRVSDAMFVEEKLDEEKKDLTSQLDTVQRSYSNLHEELQRSIGEELEDQLQACERDRDDALKMAREGETEVAVLRKSCEKLQMQNNDFREEIALLRKTDAGVTPMMIGSAFGISPRDATARTTTSDEFQQSWFSCGCDKV